MATVVTKGYPYFNSLIRRRLKKGLTGPALKKFQKYCQLDWKAVQRALTPDTKPFIVIKAMINVGTGKRDQRYGFYPGFGHEIWINDLVVNQYGEILKFRSMRNKHNPDTVEKLIDAVERRLLAVVYHEMVHWGDFTSDLKPSDKLNQKPDWGSKWEREKDVYGKSLSTDDIDNLWGLFVYQGQVVPWDPKLHTGLGP